jgi:hypothetical protein
LLVIGRPQPIPGSPDQAYPYALHYRAEGKPKTIVLAQEKEPWAHWREPVPTQLPRLFNSAIPSALYYYLTPSVMPDGGAITPGDRMANLLRPPLPTVFPARSAVRDGKNVSEADLKNRLPVKIAARVEFTGDGFAVESGPHVLAAGEKQTISAETGVFVMRSVRSKQIIVVDEELEAFEPE